MVANAIRLAFPLKLTVLKISVQRTITVYMEIATQSALTYPLQIQRDVTAITICAELVCMDCKGLKKSIAIYPVGV